MAEHMELMKALQGVLQDDDLRLKIERARDTEAMTELLNAASDKVRFERAWVDEVVTDVKVARQPALPTVDELRELASTFMMPADTAPKLCHTESCGGHPGACC